MARVRQKLQKKWEGERFVVRFRHPLYGLKMVRVSLGADVSAAETRLGWLNRVFLAPALWANPPADMPPDVRSLWFLRDEREPITRGRWDSAIVSGDVKYWQDLYLKEKADRIRLEKQLAKFMDGKIRQGPSPLLGDAADAWLKRFKNRDNHHMKNVRCEIARFCLKFGDQYEVDAFVGNERNIEHYLDELCVSPGRRNQIRGYILRFLEDNGVLIDRKKITRDGIRKVRAARGSIRWLEREQAEALACLLPDYWSDLFRVQVGLGLRPTEVITLKRSNFNSDYSEVTLEVLEHLTLKTGSRKLQVSEATRAIIKRRALMSEILFPQLNYSRTKHRDGPWHDEEWFCRIFVRRLREAAAAVNGMLDTYCTVENGILSEDAQALYIRIPLDARIGRRTAGSLLLRSGWSMESVASFLGNTVKVVQEHYAAFLSSELDPQAAAV